MAETPLTDCYICADGTEYAVHSEHVRGEPRWNFVMVRRPGDLQARPVDAEGSTDRRSARRMARRLALAHDEATQTGAS